MWSYLKIHPCLFVLFLIRFLIWPVSAGAMPLRVAAASDLQFALKEVIQNYSEDEVEVTYGSSGTLAAQILQKAPYDLFLSADSFYVDGIVKKGMISQEDRFRYGTGRIVLWVSQASSIASSE